MNRLWFACSVFAGAVASLGAMPLRLEFDFAVSDHGFVAGFADYPVNFDPLIYELSSAWSARPANLGGAPSLRIAGHNRSDDLFMFWKKRLDGLPPNTRVVLTMELEFASNAPEGSFGIGGPPAEAVAVKVGAVPFEPNAVVVNEASAQ